MLVVNIIKNRKCTDQARFGLGVLMGGGGLLVMLCCNQILGVCCTVQFLIGKQVRNAEQIPVVNQSPAALFKFVQFSHCWNSFVALVISRLL